MRASLMRAAVAIATLALVEAAAMCHIPDTMYVAQKAVDYCTASAVDGWRFARENNWDYSTNGWCFPMKDFV